MQLKTLSLLLTLASLSWLNPDRALAADEKLKALIVDGQNNHDWKRTTPVLRAILEDSLVIEVDVATTPKNVADFAPDWSAYDVIVSNYNGADWSEKTRAAFVDYMRSGGGFVSVHAADNSFPSWPEYNEMIGLGGWGGRNEKNGPLVYWEDGKIVRDARPGPGGGHGRQHEFQVVVREPEHPITRGLPTRWMHASDELYSNLRGPAKNLTVLATAFSAKETGGTGRHEPQLMTVRFGKGRVFHTTMGHHDVAMKCAGFAITLQRGTVWAATGEVAERDVSAVFPSADKVRSWLPKVAFKNLLSYDFGDSRSDLIAIEEACRGAAPELLRGIEEALIGALESDEIHYAGKQFVCRQLRRIGSDVCVESLEALLTDKEMAHNARFALQGLPGGAATAALVRALDKTEGDLRIGVIGSLGARGDSAAASPLAPWISSNNEIEAAAAVSALRRLASPAAAAVLQSATVPDALQAARLNAILACADSAMRKGDPSAATTLYELVKKDVQCSPLQRLAAHRGLLETGDSEAVRDVLGLFESEDSTLRAGASRLLMQVPGEEVSQMILGRISGNRPQMDSVLTDILIRRGDRSVGAQLTSIAKSEENPALRNLALEALGALGDASSVELLGTSSLENGASGEAAFESLKRLSGDGVVDAIGELLESENAGLRARALEILMARRETGSAAAILRATSDTEGAVRASALKAIGVVGGAPELPRLTELLVAAPDTTTREAVGSSIAAICERAIDSEAATRTVAAALGKEDAADVKLLAALRVLSTDGALEAVRERLQSAKRSTAMAALGALAQWKNAAPIDDLRAVVKSKSPKPMRTLALEGYVRLLYLPSERPAMETARYLDSAVGFTSTPDLKRRIVARLAQFPCKESLEFAEKYARDDELAETAKKAAESIRGALIQDSLVVSASHNSREARRALDGDPGSRWSTGTPMRSGMWFQIDLGVERKVTRIVLDCRNSPGDYPRGSAVYVSFNGKDWGEPVLESPPQRPITRLVLPEPTAARFVRIVQKGKTDGLFWSIHDLKIAFE